MSVREVAYVPRSQVWQGSRGGHRTHVHLVALEPLALTSVDDRRARTLARPAGRTLCGKGHGWMERPPEPEYDVPCTRCVEVAAAYGVKWPDWRWPA